MNIRTIALLGLLAFPAAPARADVEWGRRWVDPDSAQLHCERRGEIRDSLTRDEIVKHRPGLAGNVQRIAELIGQMRAAGWRSDGEGANQTLSVVINYRFVYTAPLKYDLRVSDAKMTTGVFRAQGGDFQALINREAAKYLSPEKAAELKRRRADFYDRREAEVARALAWHRREHAWTGDELRQTRTRTDGVFHRRLAYKFCENQEKVANFQAAWRSAIGAHKKAR